MFICDKEISMFISFIFRAQANDQVVAHATKLILN